jgi:hypothetical protein
VKTAPIHQYTCNPKRSDIIHFTLVSSGIQELLKIDRVGGFFETALEPLPGGAQFGWAFGIV